MKNRKVVLLGVLLLSLAWGSVRLLVADPVAKGFLKVNLVNSTLGSVSLDATEGGLPKSQQLTLSVTRSKEIEEEFESFFPPGQSSVKRAPGEIRISTGKSRPQSKVDLKIALSEGPLATVTARGSEPRIMAKFLYDGEGETHDFFAEIETRYDANAKELRLSLEPRYFTDLRNSSGEFEAVIILVGVQE